MNSDARITDIMLLMKSSWEKEIQLFSKPQADRSVRGHQAKPRWLLKIW